MCIFFYHLQNDFDIISNIFFVKIYNNSAQSYRSLPSTIEDIENFQLPELDDISKRQMRMALVNQLQNNYQNLSESEIRTKLMNQCTQMRMQSVEGIPENLAKRYITKGFFEKKFFFSIKNDKLYTLSLYIIIIFNRAFPLYTHNFYTGLQRQSEMLHMVSMKMYQN